jgi:hypothetical protein
MHYDDTTVSLLVKIITAHQLVVALALSSAISTSVRFSPISNSQLRMPSLASHLVSDLADAFSIAFPRISRAAREVRQPYHEYPHGLRQYPVRCRKSCMSPKCRSSRPRGVGADSALLFDSVKIETGCGAFRHRAALRAKDFFTGDGETVRGGTANVRRVLTSCAPKAREPPG